MLDRTLVMAGRPILTTNVAECYPTFTAIQISASMKDSKVIETINNLRDLVATFNPLDHNQTTFAPLPSVLLCDAQGLSHAGIILTSLKMTFILVLGTSPSLELSTPELWSIFTGPEKLGASGAYAMDGISSGIFDGFLLALRGQAISKDAVDRGDANGPMETSGWEACLVGRGIVEHFLHICVGKDAAAT